jgi:hypothetical protein
LRVVVAGVLAVPTALAWATVGNFYYSPGWLAVHYVVPPGFGHDDMSRSLIVGSGVDSIVCFAVWYGVLGLIKYL